MFIDQKIYAVEVLTRHCMLDNKHVDIPVITNLKLDKDKHENTIDVTVHEQL